MMTEKKLSDKEYYEEIARQHKSIQAVMHSSKILAWYRHFLETSVLRRYLEKDNKDAKEHKKICDIGCGNGRFFKLFMNRGYNIWGCDFSKELIDQAEEKYIDPAIDNAYESDYPMSIPMPELDICDSSKLPYQDNYFDYVFMILLLPHDNEEEFKGAMKEAKRILKQGGKIFIIDEPNTTGSVWDAETLQLMLGPNFKLIEDRFIRSDTASRLLSKNSYIDIKRVNASKEARIRGNIFKDIIKILIDMWIDIPSVLFKRKEAGFERLLIYQHETNNN